mmetsp:Transcript_63430/g.183799  ORF Transcript_63430/g.183799 Transcript_63430/m.183799 type:complete len:135 (+) Transcript_63430:315-719(+)
MMRRVAEFLGPRTGRQAIGAYLATEPRRMLGSSQSQLRFLERCKSLLAEPGLPPRIRQSIVSDVVMTLGQADHVVVAEAGAMGYSEVLLSVFVGKFKEFAGSLSEPAWHRASGLASEPASEGQRRLAPADASPP